MTGPESVIPVLIAVVFYGGLFGGFIVPAILGGLGGLAAQRWGGSDRRRIARLRIILALLGAALCVFTMAILDKIIGPW
jgi:peptidoglycan/LPS O-acetylase OafA/YrhL